MIDEWNNGGGEAVYWRLIEREMSEWAWERPLCPLTTQWLNIISVCPWSIENWELHIRWVSWAVNKMEMRNIYNSRLVSDIRKKYDPHLSHPFPQLLCDHSRPVKCIIPLYRREPQRGMFSDSLHFPLSLAISNRWKTRWNGGSLKSHQLREALPPHNFAAFRYLPTRVDWLLPEKRRGGGHLLPLNTLRYCRHDITVSL